MVRTLNDRVPIEKTTYPHFEAEPVTGTFGAAISGIQLANAIDNDELFAEIHATWLKYQVLFFREQELTPTQHLALGQSHRLMHRVSFNTEW